MFPETPEINGYRHGIKTIWQQIDYLNNHILNRFLADLLMIHIMAQPPCKYCLFEHLPAWIEYFGDVMLDQIEGCFAQIITFPNVSISEIPFMITIILYY